MVKVSEIERELHCRRLVNVSSESMQLGSLNYSVGLRSDEYGW
ncbi:hypothetical protein HMPREF1870_01968 [Bacteroidales bacterium KA00344]|nr:hypothetical protein HMPREF1870_01968 [Bacteroidales bacterium KA00344]